MARRKAFLTGGTGFVGLNLAQELLAADWEVTALHRPSADLKFLSRFAVQRVVGSTTDLASLKAAIPPETDTVFHVAGSTNLWRGKNEQQSQDNVQGTENVVEAALAAGARRLVVTSSVAAWGHLDGDISEQTPQRGGESWINYQKTKYLAEVAAKKAIPRGLEVVIMNPCSIMGPYDIGTWSRIFGLIKTGKLPGVPPGTRSLADVREVAKAHLVAADKGAVGGNYLLGGTNVSMLEMVQCMCKVMGKPEPTRVTPPAVLRMVAAVSQFLAELRGKTPDMTPETAALISTRYTCHAEKAQRELGYKTVPLEPMVRDTYEWMVAEGRL
jgi:nucleoside-diphosphate-sugar epimerase